MSRKVVAQWGKFRLSVGPTNLYPCVVLERLGEDATGADRWDVFDDRLLALSDLAHRCQSGELSIAAACRPAPVEPRPGPAAQSSPASILAQRNEYRDLTYDLQADLDRANAMLKSKLAETDRLRDLLRDAMDYGGITAVMSPAWLERARAALKEKGDANKT